MYSLLRKILFSLDAERAHNAALKSLATAHKIGLDKLIRPQLPECPTRWMGIDLPNPVGLAAGLDKNGNYIDALAALGFGFIEIGTVTPKAQPGNHPPRLFRIPEHEVIINRMGFNNDGVDAMLDNIRNAHFKGVLGINIGKNASTPIEEAENDYLTCLEKVYNAASYITVNISSPNTKSLRTLQQADSLHALLNVLKNKQSELTARHQRYVPLAVKIAPDLSENEIQDIAQVVRAVKMDGVMVSNTTVDKSALAHHPMGDEIGGMSGALLREKSNATLKTLVQYLNPQNVKPIDVMGIGGIMSAEDALEKRRLGATAVQLYSGLIYKGPNLVRDCVHAFAHL